MFVPAFPQALLACAMVLTLAGCSGSPEPSGTVAQPSGALVGSASPAAQRTSSAATPTPSVAAASPSTPADNAVEGSFDVGDRELYVECVGQGSPTFILETGEGMDIAPMNGLRDALGERGTACAYDRANKGRSGPAPTPRTGLDVVGDLHALLDAAAIPGPYVLVGHSAGGIFVQLYAKTYPDEVAGVLAMNPVPPYDAVVDAGFPGLTDEERLGEMSYYAGENGEGLDYATASTELAAATPPADVPLEVLISTIAQCGDPEDICGRGYSAYETIMREVAESWPEGHFSQLEAGHELFVETDDVLRVVDSMLDRMRAACPSPTPTP
jgi:pimeloyl-ACP methyl ester carboxylesterase